MSEPLIEVVTRDGLERRIGEIMDEVTLAKQLKEQLQSAVTSVSTIVTASVVIGGVTISGNAVQVGS